MGTLNNLLDSVGAASRQSLRNQLRFLPNQRDDANDYSDTITTSSKTASNFREQQQQQLQQQQQQDVIYIDLTQEYATLNNNNNINSNSNSNNNNPSILSMTNPRNCSTSSQAIHDNYTMLVDLVGEYPIDQATILFGYITPFILVLSVVTNLFVVAVLTRHHMRSATNIILCTLSLVDLFTILIGSPWYLYIYTFGHYKDNLNWFTCYSHSAFIEGLPVLLHNASIWLTLLLAGQRYLCIRYPSLACRWCSKPKIKQSIGLILVAACVSQSTRFFDNEFYFDETCNQCKRTLATWVQRFGTDTYFSIYFSFRIFFVYLIPCVSLVTLNILLYRALERAERKRTELLGPRYELEEVGWSRALAGGARGIAGEGPAEERHFRVEARETSTLDICWNRSTDDDDGARGGVSGNGAGPREGSRCEQGAGPGRLKWAYSIGADAGANLRLEEQIKGNDNSSSYTNNNDNQNQKPSQKKRRQRQNHQNNNNGPGLLANQNNNNNNNSSTHNQSHNNDSGLDETTARVTRVTASSGPAEPRQSRPAQITSSAGRREPIINLGDTVPDVVRMNYNESSWAHVDDSETECDAAAAAAEDETDDGYDDTEDDAEDQGASACGATNIDNNKQKVGLQRVERLGRELLAGENKRVGVAGEEQRAKVVRMDHRRDQEQQQHHSHSSSSTTGNDSDHSVVYQARERERERERQKRRRQVAPPPKQTNGNGKANGKTSASSRFPLSLLVGPVDLLLRKFVASSRSAAEQAPPSNNNSKPWKSNPIQSLASSNNIATGDQFGAVLMITAGTAATTTTTTKTTTTTTSANGQPQQPRQQQQAADCDMIDGLVGVTTCRKRRPRRVRDSHRTTLMLIIVVSVYLVIEIPSAIVTTLHTVASAFNEKSEQNDLIYNLAKYTKLYSNFLIIFSYSLNFSIYCSMSKKFRATFRDLITCNGWSRRKRRLGQAPALGGGSRLLD